MYSVAVTRDFIANHYLVGDDWGQENQPHAHHYVVEVSIHGNTLDQHGYLVDIIAIETALDAVVAGYRDQLLNDKSEFIGLNPSIENFSRIISEKLLADIKPTGEGWLQVKLWENQQCWAAFRHDY